MYKVSVVTPFHNVDMVVDGDLGIHEVFTIHRVRARRNDFADTRRTQIEVRSDSAFASFACSVVNGVNEPMARGVSGHYFCGGF